MAPATHHGLSLGDRAMFEDPCLSKSWRIDNDIQDTQARRNIVQRSHLKRSAKTNAKHMKYEPEKTVEKFSNQKRNPRNCNNETRIISRRASQPAVLERQSHHIV